MSIDMILIFIIPCGRSSMMDLLMVAALRGELLLLLVERV